MKIVNIGNIAEAYICDDLPAMGIVIEATLDELEQLPNLTYKEVTISATPRRNCDVGTADDWVARFSIVCERCSGSDCDHRLFKDEEVCDCFARWLQMPYKEGGAK